MRVLFFSVRCECNGENLCSLCCCLRILFFILNNNIRGFAGIIKSMSNEKWYFV